MYDVCVCADDTGLVISECTIFLGDGWSGNDTFGTDVVSETTLGDGEGWVETTVYCGVNYDGNVG